MKHFTRVLILAKKNDLSDKQWQEQIRLDMASGIKVFTCLYSDIRDKIPEPDFGIWDNRYLVTVENAQNPNLPHRIVVDSRAESLTRARKWQKEVQDHASSTNDPFPS